MFVFDFWRARALLSWMLIILLVHVGHFSLIAGRSLLTTIFTNTFLSTLIGFVAMVPTGIFFKTGASPQHA
jgi:hypothetical protein